MAKKKPIKRGPKGGKKHTPGRDHDAKSRARKRKKRQKQAEQTRIKRRVELAAAWDSWDNFSPDQKKMLQDLKPKEPRPSDDT